MTKQRAKKRERAGLGQMTVATGFQPGKVHVYGDTILSAIPRFVCVGFVEPLVGEIVGESPRMCCGVHMNVVKVTDGGMVAACWHALTPIPEGVDHSRICAGGYA